MSKYDPNLHHRRSIRLKGYDYSQASLYFITICVKNREHLFGEIPVGANLRVRPNSENELNPPRVRPDAAIGRTDAIGRTRRFAPTEPVMQLNPAGIMIEKWYYELENKFPDIICHEMIVMPNHFHCIIENTGYVRANLCVRPVAENEPNQCVRPDSKILDENNERKILGEHKQEILGEHTGSPLRRVVQWFKTMTTNEYIRGVKNLGWTAFDGKLWHRNYWEYIIRNGKRIHKHCRLYH